MLLFVLAASSTAAMLTNMLNLVSGCSLVFVLCFWISLGVWVWRDTHARTTDRRFQRIFTFLVALLFLGGLFIYVFLRPRQTRAEESQQRIDEESRLSELAERRTCPTYQTYLTDEFQVCPTFGNVLRRPCPRGPRLLNLQWQFCHRSRSDARGSCAWSRSFPSAPALDLDWKHHLNRKRKSNNEGVKNHETESVYALKTSCALCWRHHWHSRVPAPGDLLRAS